MSDNLKNIATLIEDGEIDEIEGAVQGALDGGSSAADVLNTMIAAMGTVGDLFQKNELFVPEMLVSAKTMQAGVAVLKPLLAGEAVVSPGTCIIGTVEGDLHDIGKNLVAMMIESAGFEVIDLGVDVAPQKFLDAAKENPACNIIALSALLTTTMDSMKKTVELLRSNGINTKIIVGGAPITEDFAKSIGADGYSEDAAGAANLANKLAS